MKTSAELEAARADLLAWGECYGWPSVRVNELAIDCGAAGWSSWTAIASALNLERVRSSVCFWQEGERDL